jgi:hypothetical protein
MNTVLLYFSAFESIAEGINTIFWCIRLSFKSIYPVKSWEVNIMPFEIEYKFSLDAREYRAFP